MITSRMLRQQRWMENNDDFDHILANAQLENHLYAEEFTKECNVVLISGTYVSEGQAYGNFSLSET